MHAMVRHSDAPRASSLLSGYQFAAIEHPARWRERARAFAERHGLKGTVLLAAEGINFSLAGPASALDGWLDWIAGRLGCDAPVINRQRVSEAPFLRLKIRVRDEIVTFDHDVRPARGRAVSPGDWNRLLDREGVQVVDTRNDYEYRIGTFKGADNPGTAAFTEFKEYCRSALDPDRPVAMFCTGGIRCEKAGAWLEGEGFGEVYQLAGGILRYLAEVPADESRWLGECFVFDDRVSVDAALQPTGRVVCRGCRKPMTGLDAAGVPPIDEDGSCRLCGGAFDEARL